MADATTRIILEITGNTTQANKAVEELTGHITAFSARIPLLGGALKEVNDVVGKTAEQAIKLGGAAEAAEAGMGIMAGAAVGLVGGLVAAAVAVIALGKEIFDLTKETAEFQGKFADLAQQTGFTVETLSTLSEVAKTTGGSIETVTASLGIFQKNQEKVAEGDKVMSKIFKELNLDINDNEKALRQAFTALARMPEGAHQTATALELFGRGGKNVLAIIKETNGNLDEATKKFSEMGLVVSTQAALAADQFNDTLTIVNDQLAAVGRTLTVETIPVFIAFFEDISRGLTGNQDAWKGWADVVKTEVAIALGAFQGFVTYVATRGTVDLGTAIDSSIRGLLERAGKIETDIAIKAAIARFGRGGPASRTPTGAKVKDTAQRDAEAEAKLAEKEALADIHARSVANKHELDQQVRDIEDFTKRDIGLADERMNAAIDRINKEQAAAEAALARKAITKKQFDLKDRELSLETKEAVQKNEEEIFKLEADRDRKIAEARIAAKQRENEIAAEADQRQIARIKDRVDRGVTLESQAEREIGQIQLDALDRTKKALEDESDAYSTNAERRAEIVDDLVNLEGRRAAAVEESSRRIIAATDREIAQKRDRDTDVLGKGTGPGVLEAGQLNVFDELQSQLSRTTDLSVSAAKAVGDSLAGAFSQLSGAVGDAVHSFVLFGTVQGGFKKFVAEILASLAASAAVQAVYEFAQGLAWLALNAFFPNPKYVEAATLAFASAAVFGSIAGVAALAGRAVAGNSFQQQPSGGGGGSSRGGSSSGGTTAAQTTDINRLNAQPQTLTHVLEFKVKGEAVVDHFTQDYMLNGRTRIIINSDGQG